MLCDVCKKREAVYHTIKQFNGVKTETHLCAECKMHRDAERRSDFGSAFFSDFSKLFGEGGNTEKTVCPKCGTTRDEFLSSGYVGCEQCYETFKDEILPRLSKIQQGTVHTGKRPATVASTPAGEYERLGAELKKAVDVEDFRRAAKLQEKMRKLKEEAAD